MLCIELSCQLTGQQTVQSRLMVAANVSRKTIFVVVANVDMSYTS